MFMKKFLVAALSLALFLSPITAFAKETMEGFDPSGARTKIFETSYILPEYLHLEEGTSNDYTCTYLIDSEEYAAFIFDCEYAGMNLQRMKNEVVPNIPDLYMDNGYLVSTANIETNDGTPGIEAVVAGDAAATGNQSIMIFSLFYNEETKNATIVMMAQEHNANYTYIDDYREVVRSLSYKEDGEKPTGLFPSANEETTEE